MEARCASAQPSGQGEAGRRTYFRSVTSKDRREMLELARSSRELHWPWISPPTTPHMFKVYLRRTSAKIMPAM